jgi:hypothetical protein
MSKGKSHGAKGNGNIPAKTPDDILNDVKLLLRDLTTPETQVSFNVPSRGNAATIQNTIYPPATTWSWQDLNARKSREPALTQEDVGKYGIVESNHTLYKLLRITPDVQWQAVQTFTDATWSWANVAERLEEHVEDADVEKIGVQRDIDIQLSPALAATIVSGGGSRFHHPAGSAGNAPVHHKDRCEEDSEREGDRRLVAIRKG